MNNLTLLNNLTLCGLTSVLLLCSSCQKDSQKTTPSLKDQLIALTDTVPGAVGIALVSEEDTITINNGIHYPMMSVFKLHQSLAVANELNNRGVGFDSIIPISKKELDRNTWSPMLKKYGEKDFNISIGELVDYALTSSDNNASNLLFRHIVSPKETDNFVKIIAKDTTFNISYSEAEMKQDHNLSYQNYTSPLSASLLIRQLFTSDMLSPAARNSIKTALSIVTTGQDRLGAAISETEGMVFAHKTGSGFRNGAGELIAHNDVGYFRLPDGRDYSLAVFIRDFSGSEKDASAIIAGISRCVYDYFKNNDM